MSLATGIRNAELNDRKPVQPDIPSHPLANSKLGSFLRHVTLNKARQGEPSNWVTMFHYDRGAVELEVIGGRYIYTTEEYPT